MKKSSKAKKARRAKISNSIKEIQRRAMISEEKRISEFTLTPKIKSNRPTKITQKKTASSKYIGSTAARSLALFLERPFLPKKHGGDSIKIEMPSFSESHTPARRAPPPLFRFTKKDKNEKNEEKIPSRDHLIPEPVPAEEVVNGSFVLPKSKKWSSVRASRLVSRESSVDESKKNKKKLEKENSILIQDFEKIKKKAKKKAYKLPIRQHKKSKLRKISFRRKLAFSDSKGFMDEDSLSRVEESVEVNKKPVRMMTYGLDFFTTEENLKELKQDAIHIQTILELSSDRASSRRRREEEQNFLCQSTSENNLARARKVKKTLIPKRKPSAKFPCSYKSSVESFTGEELDGLARKVKQFNKKKRQRKLKTPRYEINTSFDYGGDLGYCSVINVGI